MRRIPALIPASFALLALALALAVTAQEAQTQQNEELWIAINKPTARKLAVAVPDLATPGTAALKTSVTDPFTATLRSDLEYSGAFAVSDPAHYPPGFRDPTTPEIADRWRGGPQYLVDTRSTSRETFRRALVLHLASQKDPGKRYSGAVRISSGSPTTFATTSSKHFTKGCLFLSTIVFAPPAGRVLYAWASRAKRPPLTNVRSCASPRRRAGKRLHAMEALPKIWI